MNTRSRIEKANRDSEKVDISDGGFLVNITFGVNLLSEICHRDPLKMSDSRSTQMIDVLESHSRRGHLVRPTRLLCQVLSICHSLGRPGRRVGGMRVVSMCLRIPLMRRLRSLQLFGAVVIGASIEAKTNDILFRGRHHHDTKVRAVSKLCHD
jgi:hypothetical protein